MPFHRLFPLGTNPNLLHAALSEAASAGITSCPSCCPPASACPDVASPSLHTDSFPGRSLGSDTCVSWKAALEEEGEALSRPVGESHRAQPTAVPQSRAARCEEVPGTRGKASSRGAGLCGEGPREYLGILRLGVCNKVKKQSVRCQGAQFVLPGRTCLAPAGGGGGAIRSSDVPRAGL